MGNKSFSLLPIAIILCVGVYILAPLQHPWFPQTADGEYYSARLANFYLSLKEGSIPPRWAPTFYSGLGYPVFNFNYPVPNLLGSLFILLGSTVQDAMKLIILTAYLSGGIGMYLLLKRLFQHPLAPLFGSLLYITAPYHIHDIFHRATTGELMMFGLLPFVLITLQKTIQKTIHPAAASLVYAIYFLTHNLYTLMFLPVIIAFAWVFLGKKSLAANAKPVLVGLLMSMFFWIPALSEMKYTVLSTAHINHDYPTELLSFMQTIKLPGLYERKVEPPTLDSDQPGFAQLFLLVITVFILIFSKKRLDQKPARFALISILFFLAGLFFINKASLPFWQTFSFIRFMQHPIRLFFIPVFFGAYLGAFVIEKSRLRLIIFALSLGLTVYNYQFFAFRPVTYVPYADDHFYRYPLTSAADNEFDPIWYDREAINQFEIDYDRVDIIATPSAQIDHKSIELFQKNYTVTSNIPTTIIEKTLYFPGWETKINGQKTDLLRTANRYYGLINFDIPAGTSIIETKWSQNTPARIVGNGLSLLGLGLVISMTRKKHE